MQIINRSIPLIVFYKRALKSHANENKRDRVCYREDIEASISKLLIEDKRIVQRDVKTINRRTIRNIVLSNKARSKDGWKC
jgi:hypothetical protein